MASAKVGQSLKVWPPEFPRRFRAIRERNPEAPDPSVSHRARAGVGGAAGAGCVGSVSPRPDALRAGSAPRSSRGGGFGQARGRAFARPPRQ